jgi:hypothetical protein
MDIETAAELWTVWRRRDSGNLILASFKMPGAFGVIFDGPIFTSSYEAHEFVEEHGDPLSSYVVARARGSR